MKLENLNDQITPSLKFSLDESKSEINGIPVLAVVEGEFFVPNGISRNKRFYSLELWQEVLARPEIQQLFDDRMMLGTIGHDLEMDDADIRNGMASHFMVNAWISEDNKGMGKAYILDTPVGRVLNSLLRSGCKLAVSSRAEGTFKGKVNGLPNVDKDTYVLKRWDFVADPGFLQARPEIVESLHKIQKEYNINNIDQGERTMGAENKDFSIGEKLVESISNENSELKTQVVELSTVNKKLTEEKDGLSKEKDTLINENTELKKSKELLEKFEALGSLENVTQALDIAIKNQDKLDQYASLGESFSSIKKALEVSESYIANITESYGSPADIKEMKKEFLKFKELGTYKEVSTALSAFEKRLVQEEATKKEKDTKELVEKLGKDKEVVEGLLEKYSKEDILSLYENVSDDSEGYRKTGKTYTSEIDENLNDKNKSKKANLARKICENLG